MSIRVTGDPHIVERHLNTIRLTQLSEIPSLVIEL